MASRNAAVPDDVLPITEGHYQSADARYEELKQELNDGAELGSTSHSSSSTMDETQELPRSEESRHQPPQPVGFWHKELGGVRLHILKLWCRTSK